MFPNQRARLTTLAATLAAATLAACGPAASGGGTGAHGGHHHAPVASIAPADTNGDFEADAPGTAPPTGWTVLNYLNGGVIGTPAAPPYTFASLNLTGAGTALNETSVVGGTSRAETDPDLDAAQAFRFPNYGGRAARLNYRDATTNGSLKNVNVLRQAMTTALTDVDPVDGKVHVRFALASVLENPNHAYSQQPYYYYELLNLTRSTTLKTSFNVGGQAGVPWRTTLSTRTGNTTQWLDWHLVDIAPGDGALQPGDQVQLSLVGAGCGQGNHFGRLYVDGLGAFIPGPFVAASAPAAVVAGDAAGLTYTIRYQNGGSTTAIGARFEMTMPPGTTFNSTTATSCSTVPAGTLTCPLGPLAPGTAGSFTVRVNVPSTLAGSIVNGNYAISAMNAPRLLGAKVTTSVLSSSTKVADVTITYSGLPAAVTPGQVFASTPIDTPLYTITVTNTSASNTITATPAPGSTFSFTDTVPTQVTNVSWRCQNIGGGSKCSDKGSASIALVSGNAIAVQPKLASGGGSVKIFVYGTIAASATGSIVNTANGILSGMADPDTDSNATTSAIPIGTTLGLVVTRAGTGTGTVTSAPAGISCGTTCSASLLAGAPVVLTATPAPGSTFTGWSGDAAACSGAPRTCTITMSGVVAKNVTATFSPPSTSAAASLWVFGGDGQVAPASSAFASPLQVLVTDAAGNPVAGASVTLAAPASGASATLSGGAACAVPASSCQVATTNAAGVAIVNATASGGTGTYAVTASSTGLTSVAFSLTNAGPPVSISYVSGGSAADPQRAPVGTTFSSPLLAQVRDASGVVIPGAAVAYTAFTVGGATATLSGVSATDGSGLSSATATANATLGTYTVGASVAGAASPATFTLQNLSATPASVFVVSGSPQFVPTSTPYNALVVSVADAAGNAIPGVGVTFLAPASGASATLSGGTACTPAQPYCQLATTDASGLATVTATANATGGAFGLAATVGGVAAPATFQLTNDGGYSIAAGAGSGQTAVLSQPFATGLAALVVNVTTGAVVSGATVTFTAPSSGASASLSGGAPCPSPASWCQTAVTNASGVATVGATANATSGAYAVAASTPNAPIAAAFSLANQCSTSASCGGATPICGAALTCVACTGDAQCSAKDASRPFCDPAGSCLGCLDDAGCSGATAICSQATSTCTGCTSDAQCSAKDPATPTCSAGACLASYSLTPSAGPNGSISPATAQTVGPGGSSTFSITPAAGHHVADVLVDGASVGAVTSYQFTNVTASHTIAASFAPSSSATGLAVAPASPAAWGQPVTFTATVSAVAPAGAPTGAVAFMDGAAVVCAASPIIAGVATCQTDALAVGAHAITAVYGGDATWPGSTSEALAFSVDKAAVALGLAATPSPSALGQAVTLTATLAVTGLGAGTPGGTVAFSDGATLLCAAAPVSGGTASCSASALAVGAHAITAVYGGDAHFLPSGTAGAGHTVEQGSAGLTLGAGAGPATYGQAVTLTASATGPAGVPGPTGDVTFRSGGEIIPGCGAVALVGGSAGCTTSSLPAGTRSLTVDYAGDASYFAAAGAASLDLVVAKAAATVTLGSLAQTYDGAARAATATTTPAGLAVAFTYDGAAAAPVNAGSYAVVGTIVDANYQGAATGTLVVGKATATVTLGGLAQTYAGTPRPATATTSPAGLAVTFTYDGAAAAPVGAGSYTVVGTVQDANHQGSATGTLVVAKATATVTLAGLTQVYTGAPRAAFVATTPPGLTVDLAYDGSSTAPTGAGSYAVAATVSDANYQGSASGTLEITRAAATVTLGNLSQTYDGSPRVAIASTTPAGLGVALSYDGAASAPVGAGSYAVAGTIVDANYQGSATGTLVIGKATATVALGGLAQAYDGTPRVATATTTPAGLAVAFTYDGAAAAPVNAGSYAVVGTIVDANYQGAATGTLVVGKATATVTLGGLAQTYAGTPRPATATTSPAGLAVTFTYDGAAAAPVGAGSYTVVGTVQDANHQGSATGTLVVAKATATVTLAGLTQVYTGAPRAAFVATTPPGLTVDLAYDGSSTAPTGAGSYAVAATVADANYQGSASGTLEITKAAATVTLGNLSQTYDGSPRAAIASTVPAGLGVTFTYDGAATPPIEVGSHAVVATVQDANYQGSAAGTLAIGKATATVLLDGLSQPYTGAPRVVTATTLPPGLAVTISYAGSPTAPSGVGSYGIVVDVDDASYQGSATGTLVVTRGTPVVALTSSANPSVTLQPVVLTATVTGGGAVATGSITFSDGATTLCGTPRPLVNGSVSCTTSALSVGAHALGATYSGDATYQAGTGDLTQVVDPAATTTLLTASAPSPVYGQALSLTATLASVAPGAGTPSGTVAFAEGATTFCPAAPTSGGVATCLLPASLATGLHTFTATYGGSAQYVGSSAAGLDRTVSKAEPTVQVDTSGTPSAYGAPVTFTATVRGPAGAPTGAVTFTDGATTLCAAVPLDAGVARCTAAALPFGNHVVTAAYAGDANHTTASAFVAQFVEATAPTVSASASPSPATFGDTVTLTATVIGGGVVPGGQLTFVEAGTTLCTATLDAGGVARCTSVQLAAGDHPITAQYLGDGNYQAATAAFSLSVAQAPVAVTLASSANPSTYGGLTTFTATVGGPGGTPAGGVTFRDGAVVLCGGERPLTAGKATCTLSGAISLTGGPHGLTVAYGGGGNYLAGTSAPLAQVVDRATPVVSLDTSVNPSTFGTAVTFTATLVGAGVLPAGDVTFTVGATSLCGPVTASAGVARCTTSALPQGTHPVTATYGGDGNYVGGAATRNQVVWPATPTVELSADPSPSVFGQDVTLTVRVGGVAGASLAPTGTVTIIEGSTSLCGGPLALVNGVASCGKADFSAGDHLLAATYSGDANYTPGAPGGLLHTVDRAPTALDLAVAPAAVVHGEPILFTATVTVPAPGAGLPTGTVDFYDGAVVIGTGEVDPATGLATFTVLPDLALAAGEHAFMATYGGDGSFEGSASPTLPAYTIGQASSLVTITPTRTPSVFGEAVTFTIDVTPVAPGGGRPGGTIAVTLDGGAPFDLPVVGGVATFTTATLSVGPHAIAASYPGDGNFLPATGSHAQVVDPASSSVGGVADLEPTVYGQRVTITAAVRATGPGTGTPSGAVRLLLGASQVASGTLAADGTARLSVATLPVGLDALTLEYAGDGRFLGSQSGLDHLVLPAFTEVTVALSAAETVFGAPVTVSAAVTPAFFGVGAPTGSVTFLDGISVLQVVPLDAAGRASFVTGDLGPGAHAITAAYGGDGSFLDNSSLPAQALVRPASITLGLGVGPNPSVYGEAVTWSVQALASAPSLAVPRGTVLISEGAAVLATLELGPDGRATGSATALPVGVHALTARFLDDARFVALGPASVSQQVNKAGTSVALSATPSPSVFGTPITFTARVSVQDPATGTPTGTVAFTENGRPMGTAQLDGVGEARLDVPGLATGLHQVVASYQGDLDFTGRDSVPFSHQVSPAGTTATTTVAPATSAFGQAVAFTASVTSSAGIPGGRVDFLEGGVTLGSATLDPAGQATVTTSALSVGGHAVVASYLGDADHQPTTAAPAAAQVVPAATTTSLEVAPQAAVAGQAVTLTATVLPVAPGGGTPGGSVTFRDGAVDLGTAAVDPATRRATLEVAALAVGDHAPVAAYTGDGRFEPSSSGAALALHVAQADVTVAVTADPAGSVFGQPVTVTVVVAAAAPGAGTPSGQVSLADGTTPLGTFTLAGGRGTLGVALAAGSRTLVASYGGDGDFRPGTGERLHVVERASTSTGLVTSGSPSAYGQPVTLTATVRPVAPGGGSPGGTVTFKDGDGVLGTGPVGTGGVATLSTTLPEGLRALAAEYGGDPGFAPSRGTATQDVQAATVAVEVTAAPSPARYGQPVTVTITLTSPTPGAGVPGGTVTLHDGLVLVGTATLAGGGATITLDGLAAGQHQLTVTYGGGPGFSGGTRAISLVVEQATTRLALASSRPRSRAGRPVTFTATASADGATPSGTVTFRDGPTVIGTASLVEGVARLTTRTLVKGTHPVTAQLGAEGGFGAAAATLEGGQLVENSPPVAGSGTALLLGPGHALRATVAAAGGLDQAFGTLELWARAGWTTPDQVGAAPTLVRLGDATSARWALGVTPDRTGLALDLGGTSTTVPADLSDGGWHQLALVAAGGTVTVLLDGAEVGAVDGGLGDAPGSLFSVGDGFRGEVDELRLWSTARAAAALAADARRPLRGDEPGLLGCWRMDEGQDTELFDAGPAALDLAVELDQASAAATAFGASGAWRRRVAWRERSMDPVDAGYDADGDRLLLAVSEAPAHGTASADPVTLQVGYQGAAGFSGSDQLAFRLTDEDQATGEYTVEVTVGRILACQTDADCSGGDLCAQLACVAPAELAARAGGCGCTSGGGGALALWSLLALGLTVRRRPQRAAPRGGRRP
jgi:uncharacterized repeat protein (TIGR01451 family)